MMKSITLTLLLLTGTAFAAEDRVEVASIEKKMPAQGDKVLPPVVNEKYEYYEVCGSCEDELHCDLKKKCVTGNDGKKFDSLTIWDIKWDHGYDQTSKTCAVNAFKPIVSIPFRYPQWTRTDVAPQSLLEKWDRYIRNLIAHENGHRDMVVAAVNDLSRAVAHLPSAPTCEDLDSKMRALFRTSMEKMKQDQREYDETTKHDATQGAAFP
jgi:predicted secreted Zn-dependent protease